MLTIVRVRNNCTHDCSSNGIQQKKKGEIKERDVPEMGLAIPSSPSRLCYGSLCNDLPKDPDFLATACHQTFGRSSKFSLSLCEKWQSCLPALRLPPALLLPLLLDEPGWLHEPSNNSVFIQSHYVVAGTLRASARNHQSPP